MQSSLYFFLAGNFLGRFFISYFLVLFFILVFKKFKFKDSFRASFKWYNLVLMAFLSVLGMMGFVVNNVA